MHFSFEYNSAVFVYLFATISLCLQSIYYQMMYIMIYSTSVVTDAGVFNNYDVALATSQLLLGVPTGCPVCPRGPVWPGS